MNGHGFSSVSALIAWAMIPIGKSSPLISDVVVLSRAQVLDRLAELDAMLDIMESNNEAEIRAERSELAWLLKD